MKTFFLLILILLGQFANAQGLNGEVAFNDNYNQTSSNLVCADEFSYLVKSQDYTASFFTSAELYKIDTLENLLWIATISPQFAERVQVDEMIVAADGGVYVLGVATPTCDVPNNCIWFIQKFNSTGTVEWTKTWGDQLCFEVNLRGMSLSDNDNLLVNYSSTGESKIYTVNSAGTTIDSLEVSISNLGRVSNFSGYEKIAKIQNLIYGFDGNGGLINSRSFSSAIRGFEVQNDSLFLITSDSVFILNSSFQTILQTQIPTFSNYSNLKIDATKIRLISANANSQNILTLDHQFQLIDELTIPVSLNSNADKDFSDTHFSVSYNHNLTEFGSVRHLDYSLESNVEKSINTTDIGIIGFDPYQVTTSPNNFSPPDFYNVSISANVQLKNFGDTILNSCRINYFIGPSYACGYRCFNEEFTNLNLPPGDSIWVDIGTFFSDVTYVSGDPLTKEFCLYTSHPNKRTDLIVPNDEFCIDLILGNVGLYQDPGTSVSISPNPAQSILYIENGNDSGFNYNIYDLQGKMILSGSVSGGHIDISPLVSGMYVIHLNTDSGRQSSPVNFVKL